MNKDPLKFTVPITNPPKPGLRTPFDDLLVDLSDRKITTRRQWEGKRRRIIRSFRSTLGKFPTTSSSIHVRELEREKLKHFERRKLQIRVDRDEVITAYLCVPRRLRERRAAVLCLPETDEIAHEKAAGLHGMGLNAYGARLAEQGFVTLCPDHFVAGERAPRLGAFVTTEFYEKYPQWSAVGKAIWDHQICLNYLETVDCVDSGRIGCMGHSLGAHSAVFLAAVDERVQCVVSNCGISSFRCNPNRCQWSRDGWYIYFPTLRALFLRGRPAPFDFHELGAALAPRAWLDISSLADPTFHGGEHLPGMFVRITEVFKLLGCPGKFSFYTHSEAHGMFEHSFALASAWLKRWLP